MLSFMVFLGMFLFLPKTSYAAADITTLSKNESYISEIQKLKINKKTYDKFTTSSGLIKIESYGNDYLILLKHPKADRNKKKTFTGAATFYFKNIGTVDGKNVDAEIKIDVGISKRRASHSKEDKTYILIGKIKKDSVSFGKGETPKYYFNGKKNISADIKIKYQDTAKVVELPFYQLVYDIDIYRKDFFNEAWQPISGYSKYYVYKGHKLVIDENLPKFSTISKEKNYESMEDMVKLAGVYSVTRNGSFKSKHFENDNCATELVVFSQFTDSPSGIFTKPVKKVNGASSIEAEEGEDLTFSISFAGPTFMKNLITPLSSMKITDTLPEGLTYKSAKLTASGKDLISSGDAEITYDEEERTVTAGLKSSWLSKLSNYKGQNFVLTIKAEVDGAGGVLLNKAYLNMGTAKTSVTNDVSINIVKSYQASYRYISKTEGMDLPPEISVSSGEYSISDDAKYKEGETVINKKDEKPQTYEGSVYVVKSSDGKIIGRWILSWDKDSLVMSGEPAEFTGSWEYVDAEKYKAHYSYRAEGGGVLPSEISTKEGDFKISDDEEYASGQTVVRKDTVKEGAKLEVRNARGEYIGCWSLASWNKDSDVATGTDVWFIGTWEYESAPRLTIRKTIKDDIDSLNFAHGEPAFIFEISSDATCYENLSFTEDAVKKAREKGTYTDEKEGAVYTAGGGKISAEKTLVMEKKTYSVSELDTYRYSASSASGHYAESKKELSSGGGVVTADFAEKGEDAIVIFENEKTYNSNLSHSNCIVNRLNLGYEIPRSGYYETGSGLIYIEGDTFPKAKEGDTYEYGDYIYTYYDAVGAGPGWHVKAREQDKEEYGEILESIGGVAVTSMEGCFEGCEELAAAPSIPKSITSLKRAFLGCEELKTVGDIPQEAEDISSCFEGCANLTGKIRLLGEPSAYDDAFLNTALNIRLCHSFSESSCDKICDTANNGNVYCGIIDGDASYYDKSRDILLSEGDEFPETAGAGDIYKEGEYEYRYNENRTAENTGKCSWEENDYNMWCVAAADPDKAGYAAMKSMICSDKVEGVINTFYENVNLKNAPKLSIYAKDMSGSFKGCTSLKTAPEIPRSVTDLSFAFSGCTNLNSGARFGK